MLDDIARLRDAGISEISIDLIAGLPHQTAESWRYSLAQTVAAGVPHVSVYMLEVDEDSRLGRELIAGGTRYHAHHVPDEDLTADFYLPPARSWLRRESRSMKSRILRAARGLSGGFPAHASRHNLKYWLRQPYMGFGVDAHSMLPARDAASRHSAVRFATCDELDRCSRARQLEVTRIDERLALEETWFLGLRLNRGVRLSRVESDFGAAALSGRQICSANLNRADLQ